MESLNFNKSTRIGIILILAILMGAVILFRTCESKSVAISTIALDSIVQPTVPSAKEVVPDNAYAMPENVNIALFEFDPNSATKEQFVQLGLNARVANMIVNYRNKGGQFRKPEDFSKIYALTEDDFKRLKPYIRISTSNTSEKIRNNYPTFQKDSTRSAYKPKTLHPIKINSATVEELMTLKGIGTGYANRIINFRNKLGGFHSASQIKEVYGLPDSVFQSIHPYMIIEIDKVKKISVNSCTEEELAAHAYVGPKMAARIIQVRKDLGGFKNVEDLKFVPLLNEEKYRKIAYYLSID